MYSLEQALNKKLEKIKRQEKLAQLESQLKLNENQDNKITNESNMKKLYQLECKMNMTYRKNIQEIWEIKQLEIEKEREEDELEWNNFQKWNKVNDKSFWNEWINENLTKKQWASSEHIVKLKSGWEKTYLLKIRFQFEKEDEVHDKFHTYNKTICDSYCYSNIVRKYLNLNDAYHCLNENVFTEMVRAWDNMNKKFIKDHTEIHNNTKTICKVNDCLEANKLWLEVLRKNE